jgi:hypothetical protein
LRTRHLILLVSLALLPALVVPASAQVRRRPRLAAALDVTDRRIAEAAGVLAGAGRADAEAELTVARELQAEARRALGSPRPRIVVDLTLRARDHADRAVAMVHGLPDPDRVVAQLEQTRDGLDRAGEMLRDCPDERAQGLLREAGGMQDLAESAAHEDRYLAALQLTFGARERLSRALRVCRREEDLPTSSARALERTDQVVARARATLGAGVTGPAGEALSRAEAMQGEALEHQRAREHDAAMRLTFGARASALRALRLAPPHP